MDALEVVFNGVLASYGDDQHEVQFELSHPDMSDPTSGVISAIYPLTANNRDAMIIDLLDQLLTWNQSSKPTAAMSELSISVTVGMLQLPGQGRLFALGDDAYQRKGYSKMNIRGTLFYVDVEQDCFWAAIYFGLVYNIFESEAREAMTKARIKALADALDSKLTASREELGEVVKTFFCQHAINIDQFEPGSVAALKKVYQKFSVQVSIFDDTKCFQR